MNIVLDENVSLGLADRLRKNGHKELGITPEIRGHIYETYFEAHEPERGTIKKLKTLIKKYPHIPHSKNFLTAAYDSLGNKNKAYEYNKLI